MNQSEHLDISWIQKYKYNCLVFELGDKNSLSPTIYSIKYNSKLRHEIQPAFYIRRAKRKDFV
jgi:hypothetical protein